MDWQALARQGTLVLFRGARRVGRILLDEVLAHLARRCRLDAAWQRERTIGYRAGGWRLYKRRLVLSFDDGPLRKKTPRLLDILKQRKLKATFFVVGKMIYFGSYRIIGRILREGHTLGNHSYHHWTEMHRHPRAKELLTADFRLTQAMVDLALLAKSKADFRRLRKRLLGTLGDSFHRRLLAEWPGIHERWQAILRERRPDDASSPYPMVFVRPPGGAPFSRRWSRAHRRTYSYTLRALGLINVMWDDESGDSDPSMTPEERRDPDRLVDDILAGTRRGGVFLMHDRIGLKGLDAALGRLIARKRPTLTDLPTAARNRFWCPPTTVSLIIQTLHALDYRGAPKGPPYGLMPRRR